MASGGKRGGAGDRVLESRHVIGLFMMMMLFSGVFFTLGYVMGRDQADGQVRAATDSLKKLEIPFLPRPSVASQSERATPLPAESPTDTATPPSYGLGVLSRR